MALNWAIMMPRDASLSDSYTSDRCYFSVRKIRTNLFGSTNSTQPISRSTKVKSESCRIQYKTNNTKFLVILFQKQS